MALAPALSIDPIGLVLQGVDHQGPQGRFHGLRDRGRLPLDQEHVQDLLQVASGIHSGQHWVVQTGGMFLLLFLFLFFRATTTRSSSREARIRVPTFFRKVYFSRETLPQTRVEGHYWGDLDKQTHLMTSEPSHFSASKLVVALELVITLKAQISAQNARRSHFRWFGSPAGQSLPRSTEARRLNTCLNHASCPSLTLTLSRALG